MIQVVDEFGKPIPGLYRNGPSLVVTDNSAYNKYRSQREVLLAKDKKIAELEDKLEKLAAAVELLIQQNKA